MKKSVLSLSLAISIAVCVTGCSQDNRDIRTKVYDDLVMVNQSIVSIPTSSLFCKGGIEMGCYVFIFENRTSRTVWLDMVSIKFDPTIEKPLVEGVVDFNWELGEGRHKVYEVIVTFKDREQMKEYWLPNGKPKQSTPGFNL